MDKTRNKRFRTSYWRFGKENETGNVSYEATNHETMTKLRAEKVKNIQYFIPDARPDSGNEHGKIAVLGWGSTYGAIKTAVRELISEGYDVAPVSYTHLTLPTNR